MIMTENLPTQDIKTGVLLFLENFRQDAFKPVIVGRIMEEMNLVVQLSIEFLEKQTTITYDDPDLQLEIQRQANRFYEFNEKYRALLGQHKDYEVQRAKADEVEDRHRALENEIREIEQTLATEKERMKTLRVEYEKQTAQLQGWKQAMLEMKEKHEENRQNYRLHFESDDYVLNRILKFDGNARSHVDAIAAHIRNKLGEFDDLLDTCIRKQQDVPIHEFEDRWNDLLNKPA